MGVATKLHIAAEIASLPPGSLTEGLQTPSPIERPLATSERQTLLIIIAALCDFSDIKHQERGAARQIRDLTEEIGAAVSDDTVRRHLKEIPAAIEARRR